jgi:predicted metallopeptidase
MKYKTYRLEGEGGRLIVASYDKIQLVTFARKFGIRGTLKKQYEPSYILKLMRDRNKLLFSNNEQKIEL